MLDPNDNDALMARLRQVRRRSEALAAPLSAEDCQVQSMPDASPVKWHLAHTTWFFETFVLERGLPGYSAFHPAFRVLYNSYYNGIGDAHPRPQRGLLSRPALDEVVAYRQRVDAGLDMLAGQGRPVDAELTGLIELGINHEEQHQELILTDVKHMLSCNPLRPVYAKGWPLAAVSPQPLAWHEWEAGLRHVGHAGSGFHYDNETPRHRQFVPAFALASRLVTNGEFAAFIEDGGYRRPELWLSLGWDAVRSEGWQSPMYWERQGGTWRVFTLQGAVDMDPHTPVCHVSLFEADAYARWAGARLPTEAEWETAAADAPVAGNLLEAGALHPVPLPQPRHAGPDQLFGDVWEWTGSAYAPYPGFRPAPGAVGEYNGKFMCNQYVLRGGSCATPKRHIRATYRNFFPPGARWQFCGIRLARSAAE
jgi:ergothioneine biosynthesis protein EgtB